jgi:hypothetical protein
MQERCPTCGEKIMGAQAPQVGVPVSPELQLILNRGGFPMTAMPCGHAIQLRS